MARDTWWGRWDLNPRLLALRLSRAGSPAPQVHRRVRLWYPFGDNRCLDQVTRIFSTVLDAHLPHFMSRALSAVF